MDYNKQKITILLVEDNKAVGMATIMRIEQRFGKEQCEVHLVEKATDAMALINRPDLQFNVVITDMVLRDGNGITLAGSIKKVGGGYNLPVAIYSAEERMELFNSSIKNGYIKAAFRKMYDEDKLLTFLSEIYNRKKIGK